MNFVDPKEYDIPGLVRKNRYRTILPSEYLLPQGGEGRGWVLSSRKASSPETTNNHHRRWGRGQANQGGEGNESRHWLPFWPWTLALPG